MIANKIRMGMVGGSEEGFIGAVHRMSANLDGLIELVCGCFSSDYQKSMQTGKSLFLPENRIYESYEQMIRKEKELPEEKRMHFVSIVTPNHLHFLPSKLAMEHGFHVVLDKPMTLDLDEARQLEQVVKDTGMLFCLTHTYTGYPMIKEARKLVQSGMFGTIRKVYVEYPQAWLSTFLEGENHKQASWRTDPKRSGKGGSIGDIGTHAFNLMEYITGLQATKICADIHTVVSGRQLDDDAAIFLSLSNGSSAVLMASQILAGEENNLRIRVYGEKGGVEWNHQQENVLLVKWLDKPTEIYKTGANYLSDQALHNTRVPAGHPEGYIEAFANIYKNFALTLHARLTKQEPKKEYLDYPNIQDGLRGMLFVERAIESGKSNKKWIEF